MNLPLLKSRKIRVALVAFALAVLTHFVPIDDQALDRLSLFLEIGLGALVGAIAFEDAAKHIARGSEPTLFTRHDVNGPDPASK